MRGTAAARVRDTDVAALIPRAYDELRALARTLLAAERDGHTLQATALVHEACLRLLDIDHFECGDPRAFFMMAARTMRRVLVDHARAKRAQKRGGGIEHLPIHALEREVSATLGYPDVEFIALDEALERLALRNARQAAAIELIFFAGLSRREAAETLRVSQRTIREDWRYARPWLIRELQGVTARTEAMTHPSKARTGVTCAPRSTSRADGRAQGGSPRRTPRARG